MNREYFNVPIKSPKFKLSALKFQQPPVIKVPPPPSPPVPLGPYNKCDDCTFYSHCAPSKTGSLYSCDQCIKESSRLRQMLDDPRGDLYYQQCAGYCYCRLPI